MVVMRLLTNNPNFAVMIQAVFAETAERLLWEGVRTRVFDPMTSQLLLMKQ